MNNDKIIVEERASDIGNFIVGRLLPFRKKRQVGPFTFIDHMGPATLSRPMDVDQHPHIGLSTLTYLFDGEIEHRDSTGAEQVITPGDVGFMTSGKGVTHTERTPSHLRGQTHTMHGYQIWVAMPKELEECEPNFQFIAKDELPTKSEVGLEIKVISGTAFGLTSPLKVYSEQFMVDIRCTQSTTLNIHDQVKGEIAFVVVSGSVTIDRQEIDAGQMLISKTENECCISMTDNTTLLLFGGKAFDEERFLMWNFVSSSKERLAQAKQDWMDKKFPKVPNDNTYIPFPEY